jgi:hypothetical protein
MTKTPGLLTGTLIRVDSLLISERLSPNIALTLHKVLLRSVMTYVCIAWELRRIPTFRNFSACKTRFSAPLVNFQSAHRSESCTWLSKYCIFTITQRNCAGNKQKSYKTMKMLLFATLEKAKLDAEYKRLKLGVRQAYDRSSDYAALVT